MDVSKLHEASRSWLIRTSAGLVARGLHPEHPQANQMDVMMVTTGLKVAEAVAVVVVSEAVGFGQRIATRVIEAPLMALESWVRDQKRDAQVHDIGDAGKM